MTCSEIIVGIAQMFALAGLVAGTALIGYWMGRISKDG